MEVQMTLIIKREQNLRLNLSSFHLIRKLESHSCHILQVVLALLVEGVHQLESRWHSADR